jgi:hypothetical protein
VLTPRTSARLQAKIVDNPKDGKLPRGSFLKKLAQVFNVTRDLPERMLSKLRNRPTGTSDARVGSGTSGRPTTFGKPYKDFIILQATGDRVLRNHERILELNDGNFYDKSRV